ncbi:MAG: MFS transporter [Pseudomonadota bacterium]
MKNARSMRASPTPAHSPLTAIDFGEFRRGWHILLLSTVGVATSVSAVLLYGFGAMVIPLQQALGWARGDLQIAIAFMSIGAIASSQVAGWLNQRYGLRKVTLCSLAALALGLFCMTQLRGTVWSLYIGFMLLALAGVGTLQITWSELVNLWFERNRGLALSVILSGTGIAAIVMPPLVSAAVERWGWQAGFIAMGALPLLAAMPLVLRWMTPANSVVQCSADAGGAARPALTGLGFREALTTGKFWRCNLALTLIVAAVVGMVTNTVPLLRDRGLSAQQASSIFSSFGVSLILGRVVVGYLVDRFWAPGVAALALAMPALGCVLFATADAQVAPLVAATMLIGIGSGAEFDIAAFLVARYFGMRNYGRLFGVHLGLVTAGAAASPVLFAALYRNTGSYTAMLACCFACFAIGPLLLLTMGRYPILK